MLVCGLNCLNSASVARTINTDSWTGRVGPSIEYSAPAESNLLRAGGQRIIMDMREDSFVIPVNITANEAVSGSIEVTVHDRDWVTVLPAATELSLEKGETGTVELTVTRIRAAEEPDAGWRDSGEAVSNQNTDDSSAAPGPESSDEGQSGDDNAEPDRSFVLGSAIDGFSYGRRAPDGVSNDNEQPVAPESLQSDDSGVEGADQSQYDSPESSDPETGQDETTGDGGEGEQEYQPDTTGYEDPTESEDPPESENSTEFYNSGEYDLTDTDSNGQADDTDSQYPETQEEPDETDEETDDVSDTDSPGEDPTPTRLFFDVAFTNETISLTATFEMIEEGTRRSEFIENVLLNGAFTDPLGWYTSKYPMLLTLDGAARLKISSADDDDPQPFPAGTAYEFDGSRTMLYDEGFIDIEHAGNLIIYLSETDLSGTLKLYTDSSNCEIREIEAIAEIDGISAVAEEDETSIGLPYRWGGVTPDFSAERLIVQPDKSAIWNVAQNITLGSDADGCISLNTAGAPAGTYKINFSWTINDNTLYETEMIVFVRHRSGGQGGHSS